jgi:hypothetical protein
LLNTGRENLAMKKTVVLLVIGLMSACSTYNRDGDECVLISDCNPGKECGLLIKCVDGKCDESQTVEFPCQQDCLTDADCPEGMHCRVTAGGEGNCVADGSCQDVDECQGLPHDDCPGSFECQNGNCVWACSEVPGCSADNDCVKVPGDCCGCEMGGAEFAVHRDGKDQYLEELGQFCMLADYWCPSYDTCTTRPAVCEEGECQVLGDHCDCPDSWDEWNPVCSWTEEYSGMTLVNECQAECLNLYWHYNGKCECMVDCDSDQPFCASNGVAYWCGQMEIECNGQIPLYPGECDPACDLCEDVPLPEPVCGEDFYNYWNTCYLTCREMDFWHDGMCEQGEGAFCHGAGGTPCPSEEFFCLTTTGCWDCPGQCILLGHCITPEDCLEQPLTHDECEGEWTCPDVTCIWECL